MLLVKGKVPPSFLTIKDLTCCSYIPSTVFAGILAFLSMTSVHKV